MALFRKPKNFFQYFIHRKVDEIYYSVGLRKFGVQLIGLYEPIFLYLFFDNSVSKTLFFFAFIVLFHALLAPLGGRMMARFGVKHNMLASIPFLMSYYLLLYFSSEVFWLIYLAPIAAILARILFFPAYHTDFAKLSEKKKRGKQVGIMSIITTLSAVVGPLIGAFVLTKYGFPTLFIIVSVIFLFSALPLILTYEIKPRYRDSYKKAWQTVLSKKWRKKTLSLAFYGMDWGVSLNYWPLFLFILAISYKDLGLISAISLAFSLLTTIFVSRLSDKFSKMSLYRSGCYLASIGNFMKAFVKTILGATITQIFFHIGDTLDTNPLIAYIYDQTQKEKLNVGRYIIFREIAQNIGTGLIYLIGGIVFLFIEQSNIRYFFILAAVCLLIAGRLSHAFEKQFHKNIAEFKKELVQKVAINPEKENE